MPFLVTWDDETDWSLWVNASDSTGSQTLIRRIVSGELKLPFKPITINATGLTEVARWQFGQTQTLTDQTGNGRDAAIPAGVPAELNENGLLSQNKDGYATINEGASDPFNDNTPIFISCWIKSNTTNYSSGIGVIAGYGSIVSDLPYAIVVDTDGRIKKVSRNLLSLDSTVAIDTKWHHVTMGGIVSGGTQTIKVDNANAITLTDSMTAFAESKQFTIGSLENDAVFGFSGLIDEMYVGQYTSHDFDTDTNVRFESNIFLSPVVDTGKNKTLLSSILAEFETPNDSSVTFSFRANDTSFTQDDTSVAWTGFTAPQQVVTNIIAEIADLGVFVFGRYQQIRIQMSPSSSTSSTADPLQLDTPILKSLEMSASVADQLLQAANSALIPGTVLGQVVSFNGAQVVDKLSLNLTVTSVDPKSFIVGQSGTISWHAAVFLESRDEWAFQPVVHWLPENGWETSGITIENTLQSESYDALEDALQNAPFLKYSIFFPSGGTYDLWGRGYTSSDGIFWQLDDDITHLRKFTLGTDDSGFTGVPRWTNFGTIFLEEGGLHTFSVYLSSVQQVVLDQWYFTTNTSFENTLTDTDGFSSPLPVSKSPFMTMVRLRNLVNGQKAELEDSSAVTSIAAWLSSQTIRASGKFNYEIRDRSSVIGVRFRDGLSIEFMQVGGTDKHFPGWNYTFVD